MDRGEVAALVEPHQVDGVEAVGLATVAGPAWDERRGNDLAVEAIGLEDAPATAVAGSCAHWPSDHALDAIV
jgi:hypothetical protein